MTDALIDRFGELNIEASVTSSHTSDVTFLSHFHGRQRRAERNIDKSELQRAVKYGVKSAACPSVRGATRWRFTYNNIVYITDESCKHEITSWRVKEHNQCDNEDNHNLFSQNKEYKSHTIVVVDHSGSMRKSDVDGYNTRTDAVYDCLIREFIEPQLKAATLADDASVNTNDSVVTLIEMSTDADIVLKCHPIDESLLEYFRDQTDKQPRSHGNYLPALEQVKDIILEDINHQVHFLILFLSDGAPSDHTNRVCKHGVNVWQNDLSGKMFKNSKPALRDCKTGRTCRSEIVTDVRSECILLVSNLGDLCGRDRICIHTVAFGPANEDYTVLQCMAACLPRSSFQKLGLKASNLKTALSSFSSSLTSLRTDNMNSSKKNNLTLREVESVDFRACVTDHHTLQMIDPTQGWNIFTKDMIVSKLEYDLKSMKFAYKTDKIFYGPSASWGGVAVMKKMFAQGCERFAYHCVPISDKPNTLYYLINIESRPEWNGLVCVLKGSLHGANNELQRYKIMLINIVNTGETPYRSVSKDKLKRCPPETVVLYGLRMTTQYNGQGGLILDQNAQNGRFQVELLYDSSTVQNKTNTSSSLDTNTSTTSDLKPKPRATIISVRSCNILRNNDIIKLIGAKVMGNWMVAKDGKYVEQNQDINFFENMLRIQSEARYLAELFNQRLKEYHERKITFIECSVYIVKQYSTCSTSEKPSNIDTMSSLSNSKQQNMILVEPELEGKFTKWNNNNGHIKKVHYNNQSRDKKSNHGTHDLYAINENEDEEDSDEYDDDDDDCVDNDQQILESIPQCFSHFTWSVTDGKMLVCDLQGVWNPVDGFILTDPAIHTSTNNTHARKNGRTDKGDDGIKSFFETHVCSQLCKKLGLKSPFGTSNYIQTIARQQLLNDSDEEEEDQDQDYEYFNGYR